jgi:carbamoylphosphate synthase large subunit
MKLSDTEMKLWKEASIAVLKGMKITGQPACNAEYATRVADYVVIEYNKRCERGIREG